MPCRPTLTDTTRPPHSVHNISTRRTDLVVSGWFSSMWLTLAGLCGGTGVQGKGQGESIRPRNVRRQR